MRSASQVGQAHLELDNPIESHRESRDLRDYGACSWNCVQLVEKSCELEGTSSKEQFTP